MAEHLDQKQNNLYNSSDSFRDTIFDDETFVATLYLDLSGRVADAGAHDREFAELEMESNSLSVDSTPPKIHFGLLLPVRQSAPGITVDPRNRDNVYGARARSTELAINPSSSNLLVGGDGGVSREAPGFDRGYLSPLAIASASGGIWKLR